MNVTQAMYDRLADDATVKALVATYQDAPAIFTTDPPPADAQLPYVVTAGETAIRPLRVKNRAGYEVWRDVRCYTERTGSAAAVEELAEAVREALQRTPLTVDGWEVWVVEASGPVAADEDEAYGRVVTVRLLLLEEL